MATKVEVGLPDGHKYDVRIGAGVLDALGESMRTLDVCAKAQRAVVITDDTVAPLYLVRAKAALTRAGYKVADIAIPAGEESKSLDVAGELWSAFAQLGLGRDCVVVALGGGVVGDLAGFIASTYTRGVPVVQVSTTLLAMVDSSVGGKTAINLPEGKNLVGTFYQPVFVCADTDVLATLTEREWLCGCGEVAKSAVIDSDDFFFWLLEHANDLRARERATVAEAITRCVVFKANVVARDVRESVGIRECLNYGHTLGHAIEAVAGYGAFAHGVAVAEGMRFAAKLAQEYAGASSDFVQAQGELLDALGLSKLDWRASASDLLAAMKHDKKARDGKIRFVLASDVGQWQIADLDDAAILRHLDVWQK